MYESFYNLSARPFRLNPDPKFFYGSRVHKRALAYLLYGVQQGEGFIVVTGDVGTGKTMLVSRLLTKISDQNIAVAQIVTTQLQADDLIRVVAAQFGLEYFRRNKATLLRELEQYFIACAKDGQRLLLIVDEAQNLPKRSIEELRMLSNFQWQGRPLLQSFLLGQVEFRRTLRSEGFEQLRQRIIAAFHLKPLDEEETRYYVLHRLNMVGWKSDPKFSRDAFAEIYQFTNGIPRRINTLCDRILLYGALEQIHEFTAGVVRIVTDEMGAELGSASEAPSLHEIDSNHERALTQPVADVEVSRNVTEGSNSSDRDRLQIDRPQDDVTEARIKALESTLVDLTSSLKDELSLLRKAVTNGDSNRKPESDEDDTRH